MITWIVLALSLGLNVFSLVLLRYARRSLREAIHILGSGDPWVDHLDRQ